MRITRLIGVRIVTSAIVLLIISVIVFFGNEIGGGDAASSLLGIDATPELLAVWQRKFGLDRPMWIRYFDWLGDLLRGDLGQSMTFEQYPIWELIFPKLRNSFYLGSLAFAISIPVTIISAVIAATWRYKWPDHVISTYTLVNLGIPTFVIGPGLLILFVLFLPVLPAIQFLERAETPLDYFKIFVLPVTTLVLAITIFKTRLLRDNLIEVLESDYVQMAHFKGLPLHRVVLFHALPNAIVPTLNVFALSLPLLIGGALIVEIVFAFPGVGQLLFQAVETRDTRLIELGVMLSAFAYAVGNLIADIMGIMLVPRLRTA